MRSLVLYIVLTFYCSAISAQNHVAVKPHPAKPERIQIKWYADPLVNEGECIVSRQEKGKNNWTVIHGMPVSYKKNGPAASDYEKDNDLKAYVAMASDASKMNGIALIAILLKSFTSEAFSRYLGIMAEDIGAEPGKSYRYRVIRRDGSREAEIAVSDWVRCGKPVIESAPRELKLIPEKRNVRISWLSEPYRYYASHIYRKISDTGVYIRITASPVLVSGGKAAMGGTATAVYFEDRGLPLGVKIFYKIQGLDLFGDATGLSREQSIFLPDNEAPATVDSLRASVSGRNVTLRWYMSSRDNDVAGFNVYRTTKNDTDFIKLNRRPLNSDSLTYLDIPATFGQYFYKVLAVDVAGNEASGSPRLVDVYDNERPMTPQRVAARPDSFWVHLSWKKGTEGDIAGYLVYRTVSRDQESAYVKLTPVPVPCCEYRDTLPANIRNMLFYKVVAIDVSMNRSDYAAPVSVRLPDITPPSPPFILKGSVMTGGRINIEWFSNPENDLAGYELWAKNLTDTVARFRKEPKLISKSATAYSYVPEAPGKYIHHLVAVDSAGNKSVPSNTVSVIKRPAAKEFAQPVLKADYSDRRHEVRLSWSAGQEGNRGFILYRKEGSRPFEPLGRVVTGRSLKDTTAAPGHTYVYQVREYSGSGDVRRSEDITIKISSSE